VTLKVVNLSVQDMAGAGYCLAHALNKQKGVKAVAIRAANNYINYPTIADVKFYTREICTQMAANADVLVFHTAIAPYLSAYHLDAKMLKDKKKLLYFHGSDCRFYGKAIIAQADEAFNGDYETLVSTPDLLDVMPTAKWMPVARSFHEIKRNYGLCGQDHAALKALGGEVPKVTLGHAPTNQERKGSALFFKVITEMVQKNPLVEYQVIQNMTWDNCLRAMSTIDVYYDQCVIGAYGMAAVEAAVFGAAVFCKLNTQVMDVIEAETGFKNPFIQWETEAEIRERSARLVADKDLRLHFGKIAHDYCKAVHDEDVVAEKFLKIVEAM
jgi:hypothetical protein